MLQHSLRAALVLSTGLALACATVAPSEKEEGAQLEAVIDAVRQALNEAQTHDVPGFPPLKGVTIRLQTTASQSAGGEIRYLVFSLGTRYETESASTIELEMKPPEKRMAEAVLPAESLREALARALNLAKVGVVKASGGTPPLLMKNISIDLKFAVQVQGSGGANVRLVPLGIEGTGKISREKVHKVSLTFGQ
ncbi:MAG: trypco2 family protein [Thermoanaerobaculia bacterium]